MPEDTPKCAQERIEEIGLYYFRNILDNNLLQLFEQMLVQTDSRVQRGQHETFDQQNPANSSVKKMDAESFIHQYACTCDKRQNQI